MPLPVEMQRKFNDLTTRINSLEVNFDEHRRSHNVPDAARLEGAIKMIQTHFRESYDSIERRILALESKKGFFRK